MPAYKIKTPRECVIMKTSDKLMEFFGMLKVPRAVMDDMAEQIYNHAVAPEMDRIAGKVRVEKLELEKEYVQLLRSAIAASPSAKLA